VVKFHDFADCTKTMLMILAWKIKSSCFAKFVGHHK